MRFATLACLLITISLASGFAKDKKGGSQPGGNTEQAILALENQNKDAALKGDSAFADAHLTTDYVRVFPDGTTADRQQTIEGMKNGTFKYTSIDLSDQKVRLYGDTAVVTEKAAVKGTREDKSIDGDYYATRVWVKQGGQWKIASFHTTKIGGM